MYNWEFFQNIISDLNPDFIIFKIYRIMYYMYFHIFYVFNLYIGIRKVADTGQAKRDQIFLVEIKFLGIRFTDYDICTNH